MKQFLPIAISFLLMNISLASTVKPSDQRARISRSGVYLAMPWSSTLSKIGGVRHKAIAQSKLLKPADSDTEMNFGIEMDLQNEDQLIDRLDHIYDKSHPSFRKFYTKGEFKKLHESSDTNKASIVSAIQKTGLEVTHITGRHLRVSGKVSQINYFLNTEIGEYQTPQGVNFLAASYDAQVSRSLGITAVLDLHTHPKVQKKGPLHQIMMTSFQKTLFELKSLFSPGILTAQAVIPYNSLFIRAMYAIPSNLTGTGQIMGINGLAFDPKDIALFWTSLGYSYAQPPVNIVSVNGTDITLIPGQADTETTVDITMALSVAPQLKEIRVYDAGATPYLAFNQAAIDNEVQVMTTSFAGEDPTQQTSLHAILMQMAAQGQSAFTASGDQGDWDGYILDPEDQPYITSVGGAVKGSGYVNGVTPIYPGEGTWSQSGGNISPLWPIPSYQTAAAKLNPQASQTMRNYPDVAAFSGSHYAPWYWIYVNGQNSGPWAGTSLSSPLWAALTCLVNENNQSQGLANMGFLNPAIYEIGASTDYNSAFHDMADGVNNSASFGGQPPSKGFNALKGWDLVTGWGTPNAANLIPILATYSKPIGPTIPSTPLQCGTWLEQYTIIPYATYGTMPTALQPQWNNLGCGQQVCTFFADKYGAVANGTMGTLPINEQAIWNTLHCNWILEPLTATQIQNKCGNWLERHTIVPFSSWGNFGMPNRYFWNTWDCNHKVCYFFEKKYGAKPNGTFGTLPTNEQAIWNNPNVNCNQFLIANPE